jgi:ribosomal protein S12 methylthiotransferase
VDALKARPDEGWRRALTPTLCRERERGIAGAARPWQSTPVTDIVNSERRPAPRISFVSLGCPKALVDSERILTRLRAEGYELARSHAGADAVIVNTCGFLDSAKAESLAAIGQAMNENGRVIVTGCMGAKPEAIRDAFPNVLGVTGPQAFESVMAAVRAAAPAPRDPFVDLIPGEGVRLTPRHYAYLKIAEGCDNRCTFCIIPSLRGNLVSRPAGDVMREAERLVKAGVKELIVIAQDTSAYGRDLKYATSEWRGRQTPARFLDIVRELGTLGAWVRLQYVYPYPHVDEAIALMNGGNVLPYIDVPFQHASPKVLKAMRRPAAQEKTLERIRAWRAICPELVIRSTFIVGFPGETEEDFKFLIHWLDEAKLDRVGAFQYEPVKGAAANDLGLEPVPDDIKASRHKRFMQRAQAISRKKLAAKVGKRLEAIVDEGGALQAKGRTKGDAPQIDGAVHIATRRPLRAGDIARVRIDRSDAYDLWGTAT